MRWLVLALCGAACTATRQDRRVASPPNAEDNVVVLEEPVAARAPQVWIDIERDVIAPGRSPIIAIHVAGPPRDRTRVLPPRRVLGPDGLPMPQRCDPAHDARKSWAAAYVDLRCVPMTKPGRYVVEIDVSAEGWSDELIEVPLRVLASAPVPRAAPDGWVAVPLTAHTPKLQCEDSPSYKPELRDGQLTVVPVPRWRASSLPPELEQRYAGTRGAPHCAQWFDDGWLLGSDLGEFGGRLSFLASGADEAIRLNLRPSEGYAPQNVQQMVREGDSVFVMQGLSHLGFSEGQLTKVWREQGRFRGRVLGYYRSAPTSMIRASASEWLVATWNTVWKTTDAATSELVTRLPKDISPYPQSLVVMPDGVLLLGTREGVLRMTPAWEETPRYVAELLVPRERSELPCMGIIDELMR